MEKQKVDMYIMTNQKAFPSEKMGIIKEKLEQLDDDNYLSVTGVELKDPTTLLIISLLLGGLGVDRFMLGETGMGVLKLLTAGGFGIITIVDWFSIQTKTKEYNFAKLMEFINRQGVMRNSSNNGSSSSNKQISNSNNSVVNVAEELKQYKELLDMGAISQEEFDKKKAELLKNM